MAGLDRLPPSIKIGANSESPLKWTNCNPVVLLRELVLLARWRSLSERKNLFQGGARAKQIEDGWIRSITAQLCWWCLKSKLMLGSI
jgi:hypothetical protein